MLGTETWWDPEARNMKSMWLPYIFLDLFLQQHMGHGPRFDLRLAFFTFHSLGMIAVQPQLNLFW